MGAAMEVARTVKNIALGASPWVPGERRYGVDSFTPDELTAAIAPDEPDAQIERITVDRDPKGTTDRARLHLSWNAAGRDAGLPATVFAKGTPSQISTRILNSAFGLCESEVRFYNELYDAVADVTLTPYAARMRSGGRFAIAVHTLGPEDATFFQTGDTVPLAHAEAMMDSLAKLHAAYWRSPRFGADLSWITVYSRRPGWPIGRRVMPIYNKKWLQKRGDVPASVKRLTSFYLENQAALDRVWEALPPTFCHGDTHAGNTYMRADGTAGVFDWQQPHKMHGMRDVTYFIGWSLDPATRRGTEKDLLSRYLDGLAQHGVHEVPTLAEAFELHRLFMVDAWNSAWAPLAIYGDDENLCDRLLARFVETLLDLDTADALRTAL
jgi:aminoglycoside phosphotransferase (APT) family kinase protein